MASKRDVGVYEMRFAPWTHLRPARIQLTADGEWERGWVVPASQAVPERDVADWLGRHGKDITVEIFFDQESTERLYVGVHLPALSVQERRAFLLRTLQGWASSRWISLQDVIVDWRLPTGGLVLRDVLKCPTGIDVGVLNAWQQVGPCRVWQPPESPLDPNLLRATLAQTHPALLEPQANPIAIEVAFEQPLPHWIGISASAQDAHGLHTLGCESAVEAVHPFMRQ